MTSEPIRWLHLSDFHVGKDNYEIRKLFGHLHNHVKEICQTGFVPDMVFISGDIANGGVENEYIQFIEELFDPLKKILESFQWKGKFFIVPGNHDVQRKYVQEIPRNSRLKADSNFFRANSEGLQSRKIHELRSLKRFGELIEFTDSYPDNWLESEEGSFASTFEIKEKKIGVAGINTAWLSRDNSDKEQLSPGVDLLKSALGKIKDCDLRILLGHHPVDWFFPEHRSHIQNLLGDNKIVYLHGHLHENRSQPLETGGGSFLQIQSGAAFQVREGDETKWKNGILWAEVDSNLTTIRLQPRYWKDNDSRWGFSDDLHEDRRGSDNWWSFPLPCSKTISAKAREAEQADQALSVDVPDGWELIDSKFIVSRSRYEISENSFIQYFDGAVPSWHQELIRALPLRNASAEAIEILRQAKDQDRPTMLLLSGAGGEGKSTALIQVSYAMYKSGDWYLLLHTHGDKPLPIEPLRDFPADKPWLVISDDADLITGNLSAILSWTAQHRQDIHFLLSARQSDWYSAGGTRESWGQHCAFHEIILGKLEQNEAENIVHLWRKYGNKGLKNLQSSTHEEASRKLYQASLDQAGKGEGAFLGAMLTVRMADGLKDHVRLLLARLGKQTIKQSGGKTLLDAFAAIALMHLEGFDFLSAPVLSQYIYDNPDKSHKGGILTPLGKEAAATSAGKFIFTRHSVIAKVAGELLEHDFAVDSQEIFAVLGAAAIKAWRNGASIPELGKWRYDLPKHFFETNRQQIAIVIAKSQLECDPGNLKLLTNLAKLYRKTDNAAQAVHLFRDNSVTKKERGFYYEWGTAEGNADNHALALLLSAISIADRTTFTPPDNKDAKLALAGMGVAFEQLYDQYHATIFRDAQHACGVLGLCLFLDTTTERYFIRYCEITSKHGAPKKDIQQAFNAFSLGVKTAWRYADIDESLFKQLPLAKDEMRFEELTKLIYASIAKKEK